MAKKTIKAQMKQRRDTKANWAATNPVLLDGELGIVSDDPNLYKVGDGATAWNDLPFRGFDGTLAQELGTSPNAVISQKVVSEKLTELESETRFYSAFGDEYARKGIIYLADGSESVDFPAFSSYAFDVSNFAGKDIVVNARGIADSNNYFAFFVVVKSDGTKESVVNKRGMSVALDGMNAIIDYKYTLPSDAVELLLSSAVGEITIYSDGYRLKPKKIASASELMENDIIPHGALFAIKDNNLLNGVSYTEGGFLTTSGNVTTFDGFAYTDYIDIRGYKKLRFSTIMQNAGCFYDADKNFVSGITSGSLKDIINSWYIIPDNAAYIRYNTSIERKNKGFDYIIADNLAEDIFIPSISSIIPKKASYYDTKEGYLNYDGTIFLGASGCIIYRYKTDGAKAASISNATGISELKQFASLWVVDANESVVQTINITITGNTFENYLISLHPDAAEIWVASGNPKVILYGNFYVEPNNNANDISNQWKDKKILWLGTSIPWGQSDENNPGTTTRVKNPYPIQVCNALGATLIDSTHGGLAQEGAYSEEKNMWYPRPYSVGGMSSGGSCSLTIQECKDAYAQGLTGADHSRWSYENLVLGKDADLYVFDVEPNNSNADLADLENFDWLYWGYKDGSNFADHRDSYVGALIYVIDKLLTEKPNAIIVFVGEFGNLSKSNYVEDYLIRDASKSLCEKFHIHYIDLWHKLNYNGKNLSQWMNADMVHPKQALYDRIAKMMIHELMLIA